MISKMLEVFDSFFKGSHFDLDWVTLVMDSDSARKFWAKNHFIPTGETCATFRDENKICPKHLTTFIAPPDAPNEASPVDSEQKEPSPNERSEHWLAQFALEDLHSNGFLTKSEEGLMPYAFVGKKDKRVLYDSPLFKEFFLPSYSNHLARYATKEEVKELENMPGGVNVTPAHSQVSRQCTVTCALCFA